MWDINEVIIRFLDGSATRHEKDFLLDWLKQSDQNKDDFSQIRDLWLLSNATSKDDEETEMALDKLKRKILRTEKKKNIFSPFVYQIMKIAAVFIMLFIVGYSSFYWGEKSTESNTVILNRLLTAKGGKGRFILPDSTVVWLNSNTILEYPETFSASVREVHLEGQAYFEVKKNKKKPFKVHAGEMEVEVLGTHFTVENYQHKSELEAVLVEGSIKISGCNMSHSVVLTPGELISYNKKSERTDIQVIDTDNYTNWMHDRMTFDNSKLSDIIINLEKWFITEIECDPDFSQNVSMSFSVQNGETLDDILKAMDFVLPIEYYWENSILHILPKK